MSDDYANMANIADMDPIQMGFWIPNRVWVTEKYFVPLQKELAERKRAGQLPELSPVILVFKNWIETHSIYRMWVNLMLKEANAFYNASCPGIVKEIRGDGDFDDLFTYDELFDHLNAIITTSPGFNNSAMVGTPMNGLLAVTMGTPAGVALFHDTTFNEQFKKVLNAWNAFLKSGASLDKLDIADPEKTGSWISKAANDADVWTNMVYDKTKPGYGFDCWNSFFIRQFVPGARPFQGNARAAVLPPGFVRIQVGRIAITPL